MAAKTTRPGAQARSSHASLNAQRPQAPNLARERQKSRAATNSLIFACSFSVLASAAAGAASDVDRLTLSGSDQIRLRPYVIASAAKVVSSLIASGATFALNSVL